MLLYGPSCSCSPSACCSTLHAAGHRLPWREILQLVKARLRRWVSGDWNGLWADALSESRSKRLCQRRPLPNDNSPAQSTSQRHHNIRRARSAVQDGQYSKAIQALTSEGLAPPSTEVLLTKHPQAPPAALPPNTAGVSNQERS